jgi:short-subunit dehydrogenase
MSRKPALLLIGSGPGIGLSTAILFATKKFETIGIISRNEARLLQDQKRIESNVGSGVTVHHWSVDITQPKEYEKVLKTANKTLGHITCVIFNAARVAPSVLLTFPEEEIMEDFKVCHFPNRHFRHQSF